MVQRTYYIDRIRVLLTVLVILHHTAITYGATGGWFYHENQPSGSPTSLALTCFVAINQAFFMGFFFLLAGYFTPASYERKGWVRFLVDRFIRLGIPLLSFILVLGPLTVAIGNGVSVRVLPQFILYLLKRGIIIPGPLWFAEALLLFSLGYCLWRRWHGPMVRDPERKLPPGNAWLYSAIGVGAAALLIRQWMPVGKELAHLQLGYFAAYIFLFAVGCLAWRGDWLDRLQRSRAGYWGVVALFMIPMLPLSVLISIHAGPSNSTFAGGLNWRSIFYALWEPFVAWGVIAWMIVWFRDRWNKPSLLWETLGAQAYTVYIIHPPILVGMTVLLRGWHAPALAKFAVNGSLTWLACGIVALLVLRIPGIRRVL